MFYLNFLVSTLVAKSILGPSDGNYFTFSLQASKDFNSLSYFAKMTIGTNKDTQNPVKYENKTFYPG
jgi:hypothetical protein